MPTKAQTVVRTLDLPVERVREIVSSEEFLLTVGDGDGSTVTVTDARREVAEDGSVRSTVAVATGEDGSGSMVQSTEVSVPEEDGTFTVFTTVPLPKDIGAMATNQIYRPEDGATRLESTVAVEVNIAVVGGKIAQKMLEESEPSTDRGIGRILRLAGQ